MKRKNRRIRQFLIALTAGLITGACDDPGELGMELLPNTDLISVRSIIDYNNPAFICSEDSLRTDETEKSLLGSMTDPLFGRTTIDLACQYRLTYYPDYQEDAVADSVFLYLFYKNFYGDTLTPQKLTIYELDQPIYDTEKYYQDADLPAWKKEPSLGEITFIPKRKIAIDTLTGSIDTLYQTLKIPLDRSLANKIVKADSTHLTDIDAFLGYFKGLYIEVAEVSEKGTILTLDLLSNSTINGSAVLIHYHETNPESGEPDTLSTPLIVTNMSARVNRYRHDYSETPFAGQLDKEQTNAGNLYLQSTGGLRSKVFLPGLNSWKDSVNVAINKAELVFRIDTTVSNLSAFPPPNRLLLTIIDEDGQEFLPKDYSFSSSYYGGTLNTSDYSYRFNIAQHIQEILKGNFTNNGFYLSTANKTGEYRRVVLEGEDQNGIELRIAYSKVLQ